MSGKGTRRLYEGPIEQQPLDCGRRQPQEFCMCIMCELPIRYERINALHAEVIRRAKRKAGG